LSELRNAIFGLLVGLAGGGLFWLIGTPLPWTLGALFATAAVAISGRSWCMPNIAANVARPFVGILAGSAFTYTVVQAIPGWWDVIAVLIVYSLLVTIVGWWVLRRFWGYDSVTAFFSAAPGGLGEFALLGASLGADVRRLVLLHAARIVTVVFTIPFAVQYFLHPEIDLTRATAVAHGPAGTWIDYAILIGCGVVGFFIGRPFKKIGGIMIVPMLLSAAVHATGMTEVSPPSWVIALAQIVIGSIAGSRFAGIGWRELHTTVAHGVIWAIVLIVTAMLAAWACTLFSDATLAGLVLAFAPGGLVEITIVAYAIGFEVAFVVTCQLVRIVAVLLMSPAIFRFIDRDERPPQV
jgi:membrane AbrB-like protein